MDGPAGTRPAILAALHGYTRTAFARDVTAGLVVGLVALPLAIAFAIASGADPRTGLVTVVVAGTLAALLGGSRVQVTGPTGAFVVVLAGIVATHGLAKLTIAVLIAGVLLVLAGLFRMGRLIQFIPYPVTTGFTAGIAVVIFVGQVPEILGLQGAFPAATFERLAVVASRLGGVSWATFAIAAATVAVIFLAKRYTPRVPGPVIALAALTAMVAWLHVPVTTVGDRFGAIPTGMPAPQMPRFGWAVVTEMMPSAVVIALLGAIESLLSAVVADGMTGQRHDSGQELVGQGLANIGSALFGGIAATGAIARTATNVQTGGRTPVAALVHAGVVAVVLYVAAPLAATIPMAVLAGILATVAWNMSERHRFRQILRMPRGDAGVLVAVFALTVLVDLTVAVTVGLLLAAGVFLHRMAEATHIAAVDPRVAGGPEGAETVAPDGVLVYSVAGPFFFGAADRFQETLARVGGVPRVLVLDLREVPFMDATGLHALELAIERLRGRGCRVLLAGIRNQPLDMLERAGGVHLVGMDGLHRNTDDALEHARRLVGQAL